MVARTKIVREALMLALNDEADAPMRNKMDKIARIHIKMALSGDMPAIKEIYDRLDGRPAQAIVGGDEGDNPISMIQRIERLIVDPKPADPNS